MLKNWKQFNESKDFFKKKSEEYLKNNIPKFVNKSDIDIWYEAVDSAKPPVSYGVVVNIFKAKKLRYDFLKTSNKAAYTLKDLKSVKKDIINENSAKSIFKKIASKYFKDRKDDFINSIFKKHFKSGFTKDLFYKKIPYLIYDYVNK